MSTLSLFQLRKFAEFETISDDEGLSIINILYRFSVLAYQFFHYPKNNVYEQF